MARVFKFRRFRWIVHISRMESNRSAFNILACKPIGKRLIGRLKLKWEDNIIIYLK